MGRIFCILHLLNSCLLSEPHLDFSRYIIQNKSDDNRLLCDVTEFGNREA